MSSQERRRCWNAQPVSPPPIRQYTCLRSYTHCKAKHPFLPPINSFYHSPIRTTGHDRLHSCLHFLGLQRSRLTMAILTFLSDIVASLSRSQERIHHVVASWWVGFCRLPYTPNMFLLWERKSKKPPRVDFLGKWTLFFPDWTDCLPSRSQY